MKDIWLKISGAAGAKVYNLLLSVATLALTARLLGPEGRGEVAAVLAWAALFSTLGHLSLGSVAIHQLTVDKDRSRFGELLGSLLVFAGSLTVLGWTIATVLYLWRGPAVFGSLPAASLAIGFLILPFLFWEQYGQSLLMGIDKANHFNRALMVGRTANLVAVYLAVGWWALGVQGAIAAAVLASVVTAAGGMRALVRQAGDRIAPSLACIATLARGATRLHLNAIGTYLFSQTGVLVVNHYHGAAATGHYQITLQLVQVMMIIPQAVTQALYGVVTRLGPDGAWATNRRVLHQSMAITAGSIVLAWLAAPYVILVVAGKSFDPAIDMFRLMLPMLLGGTLSAAMAPQWIGRGFFWRASLLTFFVGLCGIGSSLYLTPRFGVNGAIFASLIAYGVGVVFNLGLYVYCERRARSRQGDEHENSAGQ